MSRVVEEVEEKSLCFGSGCRDWHDVSCHTGVSSSAQLKLSCGFCTAVSEQVWGWSLTQLIKLRFFLTLGLKNLEGIPICYVARAALSWTVYKVASSRRIFKTAVGIIWLYFFFYKSALEALPERRRIHHLRQEHKNEAWWSAKGSTFFFSILFALTAT